MPKGSPAAKRQTRCSVSIPPKNGQEGQTLLQAVEGSTSI